MELRYYLWSIKDQIACEDCGQCCPSICPAKNEKLCSTHPTLTGQADQRNLICTVSPVDLAILGAACPPITRKILELTGIELKEHNGGLGVKQYDTKQLNGILKIEIN